ncbi:MAG TPA: isochorismatase family cysteine hydrolase [Xanthobacteraceae bacterium]|nr:isochorismatase family cysteine hydrolase [Xanthobacteraceae bacterium]
MNQVIYLRALSDASVAPCLVLVDMQQEYVTGSRLMALPHVDEALANCRAALDHARSKGFPVAFVRQFSRSAYFNRNTAFSGWIKGFEPTSADMVFDRESPSCYSSTPFAQFMDGCGGHFTLAGFAGETACLSTAIDAFHRKHRFSYLADASASHGLGELSATEVQKAVTGIVGVYGEIVTTRSWMSESPTNAELLRRKR